MSRKQAGDKLLRGLQVVAEVVGLVIMILPLILKEEGQVNITLRKTGYGKGMSIELPNVDAPIFVDADWYGEAKKKLQVIVTPANTDDNALYVRFNDDGSIHSIVVDDIHWDLVRRESSAPDDWTMDRDGLPASDGGGK